MCHFCPPMKMVDNSKLCDFGESKEKKVIFYYEISVKSNTICLIYQETPADGGSLKIRFTKQVNLHSFKVFQLKCVWCFETAIQAVSHRSVYQKWRSTMQRIFIFSSSQDIGCYIQYFKMSEHLMKLARFSNVHNSTYGIYIPTKRL